MVRLGTYATHTTQTLNGASKDAPYKENFGWKEDHLVHVDVPAALQTIKLDGFKSGAALGTFASRQVPESVLAGLTLHKQGRLPRLVIRTARLIGMSLGDGGFRLDVATGLLGHLRGREDSADNAFIATERAGFEPAVRLHAHTISSRAPSAARSPLQIEGIRHQGSFIAPGRESRDSEQCLRPAVTECSTGLDIGNSARDGTGRPPTRCQD